MQGGTKGELDINALLRKRGAVIATSLRARPADEKAAICAAVVEHVWPLVADGTVRPIVHTTMPLEDVAAAHALMESSDHIGQDRADPLSAGRALRRTHARPGARARDPRLGWTA